MPQATGGTSTTGERVRWLASAAACGLLAASFKYYGLMVLIPLADMAYRRGDSVPGSRRVFLLLGEVVILPIAAFVLGVFARYPESDESQSLLLLPGSPALVASPDSSMRLTVGLFVNDIGPFATILIAGSVLSGRGQQAGRGLDPSSAGR